MVCIVGQAANQTATRSWLYIRAARAPILPGNTTVQGRYYTNPVRCSVAVPVCLLPRSATRGHLPPRFLLRSSSPFLMTSALRPLDPSVKHSSSRRYIRLTCALIQAQAAPSTLALEENPLRQSTEQPSALDHLNLNLFQLIVQQTVKVRLVRIGGHLLPLVFHLALPPHLSHSLLLGFLS